MNWDLTYFFKDDNEFEQALSILPSFIEKLVLYKGKLCIEESFVEFIKIERDFDEALSKVYMYAHLKSDLNKKDVDALTKLNKVQMVLYNASSALSFADPEILSIGKDIIIGFIKKHAEIGEYEFVYEKLFRNNEHILSSKEEELLSYYSPLSSCGRELYSTLAVADSNPKEITLDSGEKVKVTQGNWSALIAESKSEEERKRIFEALYENFDLHKNTFATIYKAVLDSDKAKMQARNYSSSLEAHLFGNNIPLEVYYNLVEVASTYNQGVKKYIKLIEKYFGLSKYHTYDRFLDIATSDKKYSYLDAKEMFFASLKDFPEDFQSKAKEVLRDGFVDVLEKPGKRSGAYSSSQTNIHPFILLNHDFTLNSCFTVAHESGHSIHSLYAMEAQPGVLQDYTIFVAEIASTFNEHNLLDYLMNLPSVSKEEKIMCLQQAIMSILGTFYRQTLFAEYELEAHRLNESGSPINHEVLSDIMIKLYKKYYDIDITSEVYKKYVWAYIPHLFYTPFYVYQYATSFAASFKLYADVKNNVEGAFDRYIGLLKAGGSKYPMEEVKEAGVDFTKKDAFMAVVDRLDYLVDELEKLLD